MPRDPKKGLKRARAMLIQALRSDNGNESTNALHALRRWLKTNKLDVEDFLEQLNEKPPPMLGMPIQFDDWFEQVKFIDGRMEGYLSDRELGFIVGLREKPRTWRPSVKQGNWLQSIYLRLQLVAAPYQQAKE